MNIKEKQIFNQPNAKLTNQNSTDALLLSNVQMKSMVLQAPFDIQLRSNWSVVDYKQSFGWLFKRPIDLLFATSVHHSRSTVGFRVLSITTQNYEKREFSNIFAIVCPCSRQLSWSFCPTVHFQLICKHVIYTWCTQNSRIFPGEFVARCVRFTGVCRNTMSTRLNRSPSKLLDQLVAVH